MADWIVAAWDWIVANMTNLKDFLWIVFTFIATLVAILTYRRARYTLLQPLRTEVIKRQTDLLVELLDFLCDNSNDFFQKVGYESMIAINTYILMAEYGFVFNDNTPIEKVYEDSVGALILKESGTIESFALPKLIESKEDANKLKKEEFDRSAEKYKNAKKGIVELEIIHLTKQFRNSEQKLDYFINNQFMPKNIQKLLIELKSEIYENLHRKMKPALEKFLIELCNTELNANKENPVSINYRAVYNNFQRESNHHNSTITKMRKTARDYLMIDKKW